MRAQTTLAGPVRIHGVGLHTGRMVEVILRPAEAGEGIRFFRSDVGRRIRAVAEEAGRFDYSTSLGPRGEEVSTVEHLLSAAFGAGPDNMQVEVDGPELPILDGSAAPWIRAFRTAGLIRLPEGIQPITPSRVITVPQVPGKRLEIRPARDLRVTYSIDFASQAIGEQSITLVISPEAYTRHIAPARTFGFLSEYEQLKSKGLARGASHDNCIVVGERGIENGDLRFADEFVRHKVLDLLGDLALVGRPILGHVIAHRAGHAMHTALARLLRDDAVLPRMSRAFARESVSAQLAAN